MIFSLLPWTLNFPDKGLPIKGRIYSRNGNSFLRESTGMKREAKLKLIELFTLKEYPFTTIWILCPSPRNLEHQPRLFGIVEFQINKSMYKTKNNQFIQGMRNVCTRDSFLLALKAPNKNCSRRHLNVLILSFEENKAWCFK